VRRSKWSISVSKKIREPRRREKSPKKLRRSEAAKSEDKCIDIRGRNKNHEGVIFTIKNGPI
jgi:hypothetical protein